MPDSRWFLLLEMMSVMQVTETLSEGLKRSFTVVVPEADLADRREKRLSELSKTMQIPGFRPGKVPMTMVRKRFGAAVAAEIMEASVNDATEQMVAERNLRPAVSPKVEMVNAAPDTDLEFKVEMEILPDVTVPDLKDLTLARLRAPVQEGEIDESISKFAEQQAKLEPVEEVRPAAKGETLTVDFIGRIDGEAFEGGTAQDVDVEIGGEGFIPGFSEQMEGMSVGETRTIKVTFPEGYQAEKLAGKDAEFEITAKALKLRQPVTVDAEFAKSVGFDDFDEFRKFMADRLEQARTTASRLKLKRALLDQLADRADFPVPSTLVEAEFAEIWRQVEAERQRGQLDAEDAAKDEATLREEYRAIADRRVRLGLLVAEIGRANNIQVSEQDLRGAMITELQRFPGQEKMIIDFYQKNPRAMDRLRGPIFEDKVVDHVLAQANVTDEDVTPEALFAEAED
jgi:trigger factor